MDANRLKTLLEQVRAGETTPDAALEQIRTLPFEDLGFAKVDHHRALRMGVPEVLFGPGKSPEHFVEIFDRLAARGNTVLATRVAPEQVAAALNRFPRAEHNPAGRTLVLRQSSEKLGKGLIGIISAGTSDIPVAEEAAVTADVMGNDVTRLFDVGVAGLHRILSQKETLDGARAVIVCAGMEGALPGVVAGLVARPVIAVPTSVGYGAQNFAVGGGPCDGPRQPRVNDVFTRFFATSQLIASNDRISAEFLKLSANPGQGQGGTCFGDSGGPNLLDGTNTILSVNSFVTNGRCNGVTYSFRIDTPEALSFIHAIIAAHT